MDSQELTTLRNFFYTGNHAKVLAESKQLSGLDRRTTTLRDVYVYRSHIAQGRFKEVFSGIDKQAPSALQAVKLFATFCSTADDQKELVFETLREWMSDASISADLVVQLLAAQIYFEAQDYKEALKIVINSDSLEMKALAIQVYLQIDRVDLAAAALRQMTEIDDDDTLTSLASVWVFIAQGGDKVKEAFDLLQELLEKFGASVELFNSMAVCLMHQRSFPSAFQYLKSARDLAIQNSEKVSPTTLINSIVCLQQMRKPSTIIDKIISELRAVAPNHVWLQRQGEFEQQFAQAVSPFQ